MANVFHGNKAVTTNAITGAEKLVASQVDPADQVNKDIRVSVAQIRDLILLAVASSTIIGENLRFIDETTGLTMKPRLIDGALFWEEVV